MNVYDHSTCVEPTKLTWKEHLVHLAHNSRASQMRANTQQQDKVYSFLSPYYQAVLLRYRATEKICRFN